MIARVAIAASCLASFAAACAARPPHEAPPAVVASPSASASIEQAPVAEREPPPLPSDFRCGVDDEPVPVGELLGPPRSRAVRSGALAFELDPAEVQARQLPSPTSTVRAARPHAEIHFTLAPTVNAPPSFRERVTACGAEVDLGEITKLAFSVRFARSGTALWVRAPGVGASSFGACLVQATCLLEEGEREAAHTREGRFETQIVAPVWLGKAQITNATTPVRVDAKRWRAYQAKAHPIVEAEAQACARARPPSETFRIWVAFELDQDRKPRALPLGGDAGPYPEYFARCLADGVAQRLPRASLAVPPHTPLSMQLGVFLPQDVPGQL